MHSIIELTSVIVISSLVLLVRTTSRYEMYRVTENTMPETKGVQTFKLGQYSGVGVAKLAANRSEL
jgi:hypothetical protein